MINYRNFFLSIKKILEREKLIYEALGKSLSELEEGIKSSKELKTESLQKLVEKGDELFKERKALMETLPEPDKLTEVLKAKGTKEEKRAILPLIKSVKELVAQNEERAKNVQLLGSFANQLAGSLIGIFHSAKYGVSKKYTVGGTVEESYHPIRKDSFIRKV
jgi:hypothetical protein